MIEFVDFNDIYTNGKASAEGAKAKTTRRSRSAKKTTSKKEDNSTETKTEE